MSFEMDFLPASYRAALELHDGRRWSLLLALIVVGGIILTEGVLRTRIRVLSNTHSHAQQQADAALVRASLTERAHRRHQEALEELSSWSGPLRAERASAVLDGIFASRPASMVLRSIEWNSGALLGVGAPSLRIVGAITEVQALSDFITAIELTGRVPRLEVRRSGSQTETPEDTTHQFVLESVTEREMLN